MKLFNMVKFYILIMQDHCRRRRRRRAHAVGPMHGFNDRRLPRPCGHDVRHASNARRPENLRQRARAHRERSYQLLFEGP